MTGGVTAGASVDSTRPQSSDASLGSRTALLIVDMQNDFIHPDGFVAKSLPADIGLPVDASSLTVAVRRALTAARAAGALRVFVRMIGDQRFGSAAMRAHFRRKQGTETPPCALDGTWGSRIVDDLEPMPSPQEIVVDKYRYSAFIRTNLDELLRDKNVNTVAVCGVATGVCVESTARDAFMLDYNVVLLADACADYNAARHGSTLARIDESFGLTTSVSEMAATVWA